MKRFLQQLHNDDRGVIGVLVLLTIWCFVALVAMLWNVAELSVRRQQVQAAADSAAHTAAFWMSRSLNETTVQNMLIAQDGSAEVIWRATGPTQKAIDTRLNWELAQLQLILDQQRQLRNRLPQFMNGINREYSLLQSALQLVQADFDNGTISFSDPKAKAAYAIKLRQATYAANWVQSEYVGKELQKLVDQVMNEKLTQQMIQEAKDYIIQEQAILTQMEDHTAPATSITDMPQKLLDKENAIYTAEQNILTALPATVSSATTDANGSSLSDRYHTDITLATMTNTTGGSAPITPPVLRAQDIPADGDIDPINPNTGDAAIIYSPPPGTNPLGVNYNPFNTTYGGWGHCWAFPIERYLSARVSLDRQGLQTNYVQPIDTLRQELAQLWASQFPALNVPPLPTQIPDDQLDPLTGQIDQIPILPDLTPPNAKGDKTDANFAYQRTEGQYLAAIQRLVSVLKNYGGLWNIFTDNTPMQIWQSQIINARDLVLQELGNEKCFMVLQTYKLYPIPAWAKPGMEESLTQAVSWQIFTRNPQLQQIGVQAAFQYLRDPRNGDPVGTIVTQMVDRPWPYEKAPPENLVPPTAGMGKLDRQNYFSVLAAAKSQDATTPRLLLPSIFGTGEKLVAFAQAESFNWMEFNDSYGGYATEKFDEVSTNVFGSLLACPRAWRLSTVGGWNWQPRLSVSDAISKINVESGVNQDGNTYGNPELNEFLSEVHLTNTENLVSIH